MSTTPTISTFTSTTGHARTGNYYFLTAGQNDGTTVKFSTPLPLQNQLNASCHCTHYLANYISRHTTDYNYYIRQLMPTCGITCPNSIHPPTTLKTTFLSPFPFPQTTPNSCYKTTTWTTLVTRHINYNFNDFALHYTLANGYIWDFHSSTLSNYFTFTPHPNVSTVRRAVHCILSKTTVYYGHYLLTNTHGSEAFHYAHCGNNSSRLVFALKDYNRTHGSGEECLNYMHSVQSDYIRTLNNESY